MWQTHPYFLTDRITNSHFSFDSLSLDRNLFFSRTYLPHLFYAISLILWMSFKLSSFIKKLDDIFSNSLNNAGLCLPKYKMKGFNLKVSKTLPVQKLSISQKCHTSPSFHKWGNYHLKRVNNFLKMTLLVVKSIPHDKPSNLTQRYIRI